LELEQRDFLEENFKIVYRILREQIVNYDWIYDFTEIFDKEKRPLYFDFCHLNKQGNEIIANQICEIVNQINTKETVNINQ